VVADGPYPTLAEVTSQPGVALDLESSFAFGLDRLLDGHAALAGERSRRGP
jgi:hypothetical protein